MNKILIGVLLVILVFLGSSFAIYARQCQKDIESALDEINSFWTMRDRIMELYQNGTDAYDRYKSEVEAHENDKSFNAGLVQSSLESADSWYEKGGRLEQEAVDKAAEIHSFLEELRDNGCLNWTDYKDTVELLRTSIKNYKDVPHDHISNLRRQAYNKYIAAAKVRSAAWSYYYTDYDRFEEMWYRANALRQEGIDLHNQLRKINEQVEESFYNGIIPALEEIEELLKSEPRYTLVFLHGWQGTPESFGQLPLKIEEELKDRNVSLEHATWTPKIPNTLDIDTWSQKIAQKAASWSNIIFIGHSMGGKAVMRTLAENKDLAKRTAMLITINTSYQPLENFNEELKDICLKISDIMRDDKGACHSLAAYDRNDAKAVVDKGIPVLALRSGETLPKSNACTLAGLFPGLSSNLAEDLDLDLYPELADDGVVPLKAQYDSSVEEKIYGRGPHFCHTDYSDDARWEVKNSIVLFILKHLSTND